MDIDRVKFSFTFLSDSDSHVLSSDVLGFSLMATRVIKLDTSLSNLILVSQRILYKFVLTNTFVNTSTQHFINT